VGVDPRVDTGADGGVGSGVDTGGDADLPKSWRTIPILALSLCHAEHPGGSDVLPKHGLEALEARHGLAVEE